jgi:hypothetical protein
MLRTIVALCLATAFVSASAEDSPMVALAKRTNRKASKAPVITNETLANSKGRMSMSSGETVPPPAIALTPSPTVQAATKPAAQTIPAASFQPATRPADPNSTVRNIEPQSSARYITPQSTARTTQAPTAPNITPQSSNTNITPASTARNITPQAVPPQGSKQQ